jgi:PAS domain S-box-containing protein
MTERDSESRASRPFSVRLMTERYPLLGQTKTSSEPSGSDESLKPPARIGGIRDSAFSPAPPPLEASATRADARDPVFIVRQTGEILFANCALGDRSEDELIGSSIFDWIPPNQHEGVAESLAQAFETGLSQHHELAGLQNHDPDAWYDCRITPNIRDGRVVSATLVAHDITQYVRAVQRLEGACRDLQRSLEERTADLDRANATIQEETRSRAEREKLWRRFRTLMDHAGDAIFVTDPRTEEVIDVNETAARWLGRAREEVIGHRLHELQLEFPVQPPVEAELEFTDTRDTRRPLMLQGEHRRRDGSSFPVEIAVAHHRIGSEEFVLAVARDVKARRAFEESVHQSEEQYQSLFEQCWDAIYLTARDGEIEAVNAAAVELFGYKRDELVGLDARRLFARQVDIRRFQVQMNTIGAVGDLEVELTTQSGATFQALLSATRRASTDGSIRGYQCIVRPLNLPNERESVAGEPEVQLEGTVVLADGGSDLAETRGGLAAAGLKVLSADTVQAAVDLLRVHGNTIAAAVFDADQLGDTLRSTMEQVRQYASDTGIVLVTSGEPVSVAEEVADLRIQSILRKPIHPLALIQKVREH